jgi:hypothetical protein
VPAAHVPFWDSRAAVLKQIEQVRSLKTEQRVVLCRRMWGALRHAKTLAYRESLVRDFGSLLDQAALSGTFGALMAGLDAIGAPG